MGKQYCFDFINQDERRKSCDRLFLALFPDRPTAALIDRCARRFHQACGLARVVQPPDRQHISIHHFGDYGHLRARHVEAARRATDRILMARFDVALIGFESFDNPRHCRSGFPHRPLVARAQSEGLVELFGQVHRAMSPARSPRSKNLKPHLTVSYGPERIGYRPFPPIRFPVRELVLVHSEVGLSRYHVLGAWPFTGG
jgi:2'-5' RNA ligase